jgi:predicted cupin superfamily sugar epimerase
MKDADFWIERLKLERHPEGGYFRETYHSAATIQECCLGSGREGPRSVATSIYFLLAGDDLSALHRIKSDELWHYHAGGPLTIHVISPDGGYRTIALGLDLERGEAPQAVVSAGAWFGATVDDPASYALVGCTVAPGFDFRDFELAQRNELIRTYPHHQGVIERLTRR